MFCVAWVREGGGLTASAATAKGTVSQAYTPLQAGAGTVLGVIVFIATEGLIHVSYSSAWRPCQTGVSVQTIED